MPYDREGKGGKKMTEQIRTRRRGAVEIIEFANPPMNFISGVMLEEFYGELLRAGKDRSVRALVLTGGVENSFVTHYDVSELLDLSAGLPRTPRPLRRALARGIYRLTREAHRRPRLDRLIVRSLARRPSAERGVYFWSRCLEILDTYPKPTVAAINGIALGGGCEISLCCDFRYMARGENYKIGLPEVLVGIVPGGTGTPFRLPRVVGEAKALEMLLTGALYDPDAAEAMGLVHRVLDPEELFPQAMELAERLARGAPAAQEAIKKAVRRGSRLAYHEGRVLDLAATNAVMTTDDAREAMGKYAEKASEHTGLDLEKTLQEAEGLRNGREVVFQGE